MFFRFFGEKQVIQNEPMLVLRLEQKERNLENHLMSPISWVTTSRF